MLTMVEVRSPQGDLFSLPLEDISSGFVVKNIGGLDPVKATLVSSSFANLKGEQYQSSHRETRNITFKLGLRPNSLTQTVSSLRQKLYNFFMPQSEVTLRFVMEDGFFVEIVARVESCEAPLFAQSPEANISVICYDPDFYETVPVQISGTTTSGEVPIYIEYEGSIETGIKFTVNANRDLPEFTVYHNLPSDELRILEFTQAPLLAGDALTISTVPGEKGATLTRSGTESSVLYGISPQSNWIELQPGMNRLRFYAEGAEVPLTIEYTNLYGGL